MAVFVCMYIFVHFLNITISRSNFSKAEKNIHQKDITQIFTTNAAKLIYVHMTIFHPHFRWVAHNLNQNQQHSRFSEIAYKVMLVLKPKLEIKPSLSVHGMKYIILDKECIKIIYMCNAPVIHTFFIQRIELN